MRFFFHIPFIIFSAAVVIGCGGGSDTESVQGGTSTTSSNATSPSFLTSEIAKTSRQFSINGTYQKYSDPQGRFLGGDVPDGRGTFTTNITLSPLSSQEIIFDNGQRDGPLARFNIRSQESFTNTSSGAITNMTTDHLFYLDAEGRIAYSLLLKDGQLNRCYAAQTKNVYPSTASSGQTAQISSGSFSAACSGATTSGGNQMFYAWQYQANFESAGFPAYCLIGFETSNAFTLDDRQDAYCFEILSNGSIGPRFFYDQASDSNTVATGKNF